jgi:hypothetical protein
LSGRQDPPRHQLRAPLPPLQARHLAGVAGPEVRVSNDDGPIDL